MGKKEIMFQLVTTKNNFFIDYYNAINGSIGLSNKEIVVLAALVEQYNIIRKKTTNEEIINELLFSSRHRTLAREKADISEVNFNNYISALKKKSVILDGEDKLRMLNPMIVPVIDIEKDNQVLLSYDFIINEDVQQEFKGVDISGEEDRNGEGNDEISAFELPPTPIEETRNTEEFEILRNEPTDVTELRDGDTGTDGDV
jgi:hypothetical protein